MKIAMIGQKRIPSREGGIEIVVEELGVRMVERGHQVDCFNRWDDFSSHPPRSYKGIRMKKVPTPKNPKLNAFVYSVLATLRAMCGGYDVIHYHAEGPCAMTWIPKLFKKPVVSTIHGLDWQRAKWGGFATKYLQFGEKQAALNSDAVIVLSKAMQDYFLDMHGRDTIYLRNGVSIVPGTAPSLITEKWGLKGDDYILFLARIVPEKGLHYLIQAYDQIKTDKKLVVAGGLDDTDYVREIKAMAAGNENIILADFVTGDLREELMSNCFLYVLPSDIEGMSISLLESLSFGVRCLVSDISENAEASKEYANYFNKSDVADLKKKLEYILNDRNDFDRAKQIDFVTREYGWDQVVDETLRIYETAIAAPKTLKGAHDLSKTNRRIKEIVASIETLEARRKRSEIAIMDAMMKGEPLPADDVRFFKHFASEIEILREELALLRKKEG